MDERKGILKRLFKRQVNRDQTWKKFYLTSLPMTWRKKQRNIQLCRYDNHFSVDKELQTDLEKSVQMADKL